MSDIFEPQMTTQGTFSDYEQGLYDRFVALGYSSKLAGAVARSFTQYMLGYLTPAGVEHSLRVHGADENTAHKLADMFRDVRDPAEGQEAAAQ